MAIESSPAARVISTVPSIEGPLADEQGFRWAMGSFPRPVAVVTAMDAGGMPRGMTCSAVCSVSMSPPLMLICVNQRNGSLDAIRDSGGFAVNLLREGRHALSDVFASRSAHKFTGVTWRPTAQSGLPLLVDDIVAFVECGLHAEIIAGTHAILIGSVRSFGRMSREGGPLVYYDHAYGRWAMPQDDNGDRKGRNGG